MRKILGCVALAILSTTAWADISGTQILTTGAGFDLDTGGSASSAVFDILWGSTTLTPQGNATALRLPQQGGNYANMNQASLSQLGSGYSSNLINSIAVNDVIAVHTNGGNYAKMLVTAIGGGAITFQFTTYGASTGGGGGAPTITELQNNYSYILPGMANYGIAPAALFIIKGSNLNNQGLSALQSSGTPGLPLTLNGTSISVTVSGITTQPALYYTSPGQLGAVLPSTTPVGTGTITVTNNGQTSAAAQIQVVQSALGLDTMNGAGTGQAVASDASGNLIGPYNSAKPGQSISLWGSGFGADLSNNDRTFPLNQNNLTSIPLQIYVGGVSANISYRGRSQFPGVDQVVITIPSSGVAPGCTVSLTGVSGTGTATNAVTISIAQNGGTCS
jgi:uncharacterized protein (TIGR03437 family)